MIAILAGFALQAATVSGADQTLTATLRARDQHLLDALATGDRALWESALTPDAVYVDENGVVFARADYLKSLEPLPPGISGHISIVDYQLHRNGETALVIHRDDEFEDFHGHSLQASYLMTETWLHRQGDWKLALVHVYVVARDPPELPVPSSKLDDYVGRYSAGPDLTWNIRREGDRLLGGADGQTPLKVESQDVLFVPGRPRERRLFQRTPEGKVSGFIWRREGEDVLWKRIL
jgi:hypothetical protein